MSKRSEDLVFDWTIGGSVGALVADIVWLAHDILINGLHITYLVIGILFAASQIANIYGIYLYHFRSQRKYIKQTFKDQKEWTHYPTHCGVRLPRHKPYEAIETED